MSSPYIAFAHQNQGCVYLRVPCSSPPFPVKVLHLSGHKKPCNRFQNDDRAKSLNSLFKKHSSAIVQASTSQGNEDTLFHALFSTWTVYLLIVSPLFCGSNPYPCGSLAYRNVLLRYKYKWAGGFCQPLK